METLILLDADHKFTSAKHALVELWNGRTQAALHEIEIREYQSERSLKFNAYYWVAVITPAAKELGYTPEELHRTLCGIIYGTKRIKIGKYEIEQPNRTTTSPKKMTAEEFSVHVEHAKRILAEQGIYVQPYQETP